MRLNSVARVYFMFATERLLKKKYRCIHSYVLEISQSKMREMLVFLIGEKQKLFEENSRTLAI